MESILIHFEKLLATIKNPKNNKKHFVFIRRMIRQFELRFVDDYYMQTHLLVKYLRLVANQEINKLVLKRDLKELTNAGLSLSAASKYLAKKYGIKKSIIYNLN